jgi:hypothetical protein
MGTQDQNISSQQKYLANEYESYFMVKSGFLNQAYLTQHTRVERINKIGGPRPQNFTLLSNWNPHLVWLWHLATSISHLVAVLRSTWTPCNNGLCSYWYISQFSCICRSENEKGTLTLPTQRICTLHIILTIKSVYLPIHHNRYVSVIGALCVLYKVTRSFTRNVTRWSFRSLLPLRYVEVGPLYFGIQAKNQK